MAEEEEEVIAPKSFHHVTLRIRKIYPMLMMRHKEQELTAMVTMKFEIEGLREFIRLGNEHLQKHERWLAEGSSPDAQDLFGVTGEGEFVK